MTKQEFKYCFDHYFDSLRNYLYYRCGDSELATDIAQDAFMRVWEKGFDYHPQRSKSLLYKIASDLFVTQFRKKQSAQKYMHSLRFDTSQNSAQDTLEYKELQQTYERALAALPEKQRVVFLMSRMDELTYKEIAERLNLSVKAVEKRMGQAIGKLRGVLIDG